jgi:hypothetical protein
MARSIYDPRLSRIETSYKVLKMRLGSLGPNHYRRYRPAAYHAPPVDTSAGHVGFRCGVRKREEHHG